MKTLLLTLIASTLATASPLLAQETVAAEKATEGVTMRDGVFIPSFTVIGKNYFNGKWFDDYTGPRDWLPKSNEELAPIAHDYIVNYWGYSDPDELAQNWTGDPESTFEALIDSWYNGSYENFLNYEIGYHSFIPPQSPEEKAAFLSDLAAGKLTNLSSVVEFFHSDLFTTNGEIDAPFAQEVLETYSQSPTYTANGLSSLISAALSPNLPATPLDLTGIDLTDTNISYANLEKTKISNEQLNQINSLSQVNLGARDLTGFDPTGKSLNEVDFSQTTGLNPALLSQATSFSYSNLSGLDLTGINLSGKNLTGVNFSNSTGVTVSNLNTATSYQYTNFTGLDLTGFSPTSKSISYADFSNTTGLTTAALNSASSLAGIKLPAMDMTGFNPGTKPINNIDFSQTTGLVASNLNSSTNYTTTNFSGLNLTGFVPGNKPISYADFSNTTGLTGTSFNQSPAFLRTNFTGLNMTGFNPANKQLRYANFSNTTGITPTALASGTHSGSNAYYVNVTGTGITRQQMLDAYTAKGLTTTAANTILNTWTGLQ